MTTTAAGDALVSDYLGRLDCELRDLPGSRRRELVGEMREHIDSARAQLGSEGDRDVRAILDRLGDPAEIATAEMGPAVPRRVGAVEVAALVLLPIGGLILPFVGWAIGVVLLWISSAWNTRDKLVGTLLPPGGLGLFAVALVAGAVTQGSTASCHATPIIQPAGAVVSPPEFQLTCVMTGGLPWPVTVLLWAGLLVLLVLPFLTMGYLLRRLRSARRVPLGEPAA
ncbi:MAG: hypothetical protein ABSA40_06320 [Candidatus Dormibacteria bacterium]|jgi:hypothetical protein